MPDELTDALTRILLGGQDPSVVSMGKRPLGRVLLGGPGASISSRKSPYEQTLASGEWEQMSESNKRGRVSNLLGNLIMAFVDPRSPGQQIAGSASRAAISGMRPVAAGRPRPTTTSGVTVPKIIEP